MFLSGLKVYAKALVLACPSVANVSNFCYTLKGPPSPPPNPHPSQKSLLTGFSVRGLVG